ncbi:MAG TPA: ATP-binding protein [Gemmatimonadales bacterium]
MRDARSDSEEAKRGVAAADGWRAPSSTPEPPPSSAEPSPASAGAARRHALLDRVLQALPDPVLLLDGRGATLERNARADDLFSALPRSPGEQGARAARNTHLLEAAIARAERSPERRETRDLSLSDPLDGRELCFEVIVQRLDVSGSRAAVPQGARLVVLRDVTDVRRAALELERQMELVRRAEERATRERDRLDLVLEHVADPIVVTDADGVMLPMNRQADRLFGGPVRGVPGAGEGAAARRLANDVALGDFLRGFAGCGEATRRGELTFFGADGQELPAEVVSGKIVDARGQAAAVVSVLHDLSGREENARLYEELKRFSAELEERVRLATTDLELKNERLRWQSSELEKANRLKSEFLASMSHELRTPINALLGYASLLLDQIYGELTEGQAGALERIRGSAQHLLELINDLLDLARIEAGKMPVHLEPVSLDDLLAEVRSQVEALIGNRPVSFDCRLPHDPPVLYSDRTKLRQILLNLLSNAVKFTHEGTVTLEVELDGDRVRFVVSDTGIGIRESDLATIWDDFRQVDQSRTREYGGTGLGLSITHKLVERLEGEISVRSVYGEGSTFSVTLPVREPPRVVDAFGRDSLPRALPDQLLETGRATPADG